MVIVRRIGQFACLLPKSVMIGNGRASETERVLVSDDDLTNRSWLKIQSNPLGKLNGYIMAKNNVGHGRSCL